MAIRARHLMQTHLVSVAPEDPLGSVQRLFADEEIHGAPVVDEEGRVVGVISSLDLLRAASESEDAPRAEPHYVRALLEFSTLEDWSWPSDLSERLSGQTVAEHMTSHVVAVDVDATLPEVAGALRQNHVHRVLVVENENLRGIISSLDLVALLEKDEVG